MAAAAFPKKWVRVLVLLMTVSLALMFFIGIWRGKGRRMEQSEVSSSNASGVSAAEMKLTDMEYTEMQEGRRVWTLRASEAEYFQEDQKTALKSVRLVFFLKDGDEIHLESNRGILYAGTKDIELWDSVRATLPQGYQLATERASYKHKQELITSQDVIRMIGPDVQLRGGYWKFLIPERRAVIEGGVRAAVASPLSE